MRTSWPLNIIKRVKISASLRSLSLPPSPLPLPPPSLPIELFAAYAVSLPSLTKKNLTLIRIAHTNTHEWIASRQKRHETGGCVCVCHRTCNESINFCLESEWVFATYSPNPTHRRNISIHRSSQQPVGIQNDLWTKILDNNKTIEVYTALSNNKKRRDNFHRIDNRKVKFLCVKTSIGLCISTKKAETKTRE